MVTAIAQYGSSARGNDHGCQIAKLITDLNEMPLFMRQICDAMMRVRV